MGNLCSAPTAFSPRGQRHGDAVQRYGYRPDAGQGKAQYMYAGQAYGAPSKPAELDIPDTAGHRGAAAHPAPSTPTTTTTTTTSETAPAALTTDAQQPQHAAVASSLRTPIQEDVSEQPEVDDYYQQLQHQHSMHFNWTKGKLIGAGAFGRVFQGLDNDTGQIVAVKQVALTKDEALKGRVAEHIKALEAEVAVLRQLNHRNIVRYLGTERCDDTLNIFLEFVPGGSIASLIDKFGPLQESVVRKYTQQILRGLEYLHQKKIMHRDIKGANILVDGQGTVKLADFGASKKIEDLATVGSGSKSIRGTPYWMAPEVIKQTGHGRPADIWSLGCVVIEMATGRPPWSNCNTQVAAMFHIASSKDPPPLPDCLSPEARDFLLLCFNRVPRERPNATRLLRHPWMASIPPNPSSLSASGGSSLGRTVANSSNGPTNISQRHPLVPVLQLQAVLSPPSPIQEEGPDTARSAAQPPPAPPVPTPPSLPPQHPSTSVSSSASALPPHTSNGSAAPRLTPSPTPGHHMQLAIGPLEQGRRQSLMPQTTSSMALLNGLPPLPPVRSGASAPAPAVTSLALPSQTATVTASMSAPSPPSPAASKSAHTAPCVMASLGQGPAEQVTSIVSPNSIPAALAAAAATAAGHRPSLSVEAPAAASNMPVIFSPTSGRPQAPLRSSMMTLDWNPMAEPSWMPGAHPASLLAGLAGQSSAPPAAPPAAPLSAPPAADAAPKVTAAVPSMLLRGGLAAIKDLQQASSVKPSAKLQHAGAGVKVQACGAGRYGGMDHCPSPVGDGSCRVEARRQQRDQSKPDSSMDASEPRTTEEDGPTFEDEDEEHAGDCIDDTDELADQPMWGNIAMGTGLVGMNGASAQRLPLDVTSTASKASSRTVSNPGSGPASKDPSGGGGPLSGELALLGPANLEPVADPDPVRQSKMQRWRDELGAELERQRAEQRQAAGVGRISSAITAAPVSASVQLA
ncbi:kinase-like domain-containing protein [Haematococcus lacustris]